MSWWEVNHSPPWNHFQQMQHIPVLINVRGKQQQKYPGILNPLKLLLEIIKTDHLNIIKGRFGVNSFNIHTFHHHNPPELRRREELYFCIIVELTCIWELCNNSLKKWLVKSQTIYTYFITTLTNTK